MGIAIRTAIIIPYVIVLVLFTASNQTAENISLLNYQWQSSIGIVALETGFISFCIGSLSIWFSELKQRRRARRAEQELRKVKKELQEQKSPVVTDTVSQEMAPKELKRKEPIIVTPPDEGKKLDDML